MPPASLTDWAMDALLGEQPHSESSKGTQPTQLFLSPTNLTRFQVLAAIKSLSTLSPSLEDPIIELESGANFLNTSAPTTFTINHDVENARIEGKQASEEMLAELEDFLKNNCWTLSFGGGDAETMIQVQPGKKSETILAVAVGAYFDNTQPLYGPMADAKALKEIARSRQALFLVLENPAGLHHFNATLKLSVALKPQPFGQGMVYWSGHGVKDGRGFRVLWSEGLESPDGDVSAVLKPIVQTWSHMSIVGVALDVCHAEGLETDLRLHHDDRTPLLDSMIVMGSALTWQSASDGAGKKKPSPFLEQVVMPIFHAAAKKAFHVDLSTILQTASLKASFWERQGQRGFASVWKAVIGRWRRCAGLVPLTWTPQIVELVKDFHGRHGLTVEVKKLVEEGIGMAPKIVLVLGSPGQGKSAWAAHLTSTWSAVGAHHFLQSSDAITQDRLRWLYNLVYRLQAHLGLDRVPDEYMTGGGQRLLERILSPDLSGEELKSLFREFMHALKVGSLKTDRDPVVVVIDGLDEATDAGPDWLFGLLADLARFGPSWLVVVATSRPDSVVMEKLQEVPARQVSRVTMDSFDEENSRDLRGWLTGRAPKDDVRAIVEASEGNFLYARLVLDDMVGGNFRDSALPAGLGPMFSLRLRSRFGGDDELCEALPVLNALVAAQGLVPKKLIVRAASSTTSVEDVMHKISIFLRQSGEDLVALYHKSFVEWAVGTGWRNSKLQRQLASVDVGHCMLAKACIEAWQQGAAHEERVYVLSHLGTHLAAIQSHEVRGELLTLLFDSGTWFRDRYLGDYHGFLVDVKRFGGVHEIIKGIFRSHKLLQLGVIGDYILTSADSVEQAKKACMRVVNSTASTRLQSAMATSGIAFMLDVEGRSQDGLVFGAMAAHSVLPLLPEKDGMRREVADLLQTLPPFLGLDVEEGDVLVEEWGDSDDELRYGVAALSIRKVGLVLYSLNRLSDAAVVLRATVALSELCERAETNEALRLQVAWSARMLVCCLEGLEKHGEALQMVESLKSQCLTLVEHNAGAGVLLLHPGMVEASVRIRQGDLQVAAEAVEEFLLFITRNALDSDNADLVVLWASCGLVQLRSAGPSEMLLKRVRLMIPVLEGACPIAAPFWRQLRFGGRHTAIQPICFAGLTRCLNLVGGADAERLVKALNEAWTLAKVV